MKVTLAGQWLRFAVQFLTVVGLTRLVSPAEFGRYDLAFAVFGLAVVLGDLGLSLSVIQAKTVTSAEKTRLFWIGCLFSTILFVGFLPIGLALSAIYEDVSLTWICMLLSTIFLFNGAASQFRASMIRDGLYTRLAVIDVTAQVVATVTTFVLAINGLGVLALIANQVAFAALSLLMLVYMCPWRPQGCRGKVNVSSHIRYGAPSAGTQILVYLTSNIDTLTIGKVASLSSVGLYARAFQLYKMPNALISDPLTRVALPSLSRSFHEGKLCDRATRMHGLLMYPMLAAYALVTVLSDPLVDILLGQRFAGAADLLRVLACAGFVQQLGYVTYWMYLAAGRTTLQLMVSIPLRILACLVIVTFGILRGAEGVAWAVCVSAAVASATHLVVLRAAVGLSIRNWIQITVRPLFLSASIALAAFFVAASLKQSVAIVQMVGGLCGAVVLGSILLLTPYYRGDRKLMLRILSSRLS